MFEWFQLEAPNTGKEAAKARLILFRLLEELSQRYSVPASRIFLWGFSQGGMLALDAGLRFKEPEGTRLGGIACLSGLLLADAPFRESIMFDPASYYLQDQGDLQQTLAGAAVDKLPVFIAHGSYDPVVPAVAGQLARDMLEQAGIKVEYFEFPGQHQITLPEIQALAKFIDKSFTGDYNLA